jgi:Glyoxalase-like domain
MNASIYAVTFDCEDAAKLAEFWSQVLDKSVDGDASTDFASIGLNEQASARPHMMFSRVPEGKTAKNRVHLDLISADLAGTVRRLVSLGARRGEEFTESGFHWVTLTDPEGNEFDAIAEQA